MNFGPSGLNINHFKEFGMLKQERNVLFKKLREEAKQNNAWEALELLQQTQTAFDCADFSYGKTFTKQLMKIDSSVAKIRKILPKSDSTNKLESERRLYQSVKDSSDDDLDPIDPGFCWCSDDD